MTSKSTKAYEHLFSYVHKFVLPLNGKQWMMDYEHALEKALKAVLTQSCGSEAVDQIEFLHCWFHFVNACKRNATELLQLKKHPSESNDEALRLYQQLVTLPLLPPGEITTEFNRIKSIGQQRLNQIGAFKKFLEYYEKEWIQKV